MSAPVPVATPVVDARPDAPAIDEEPPPPPLFTVDWANTPLATDADANAVWAKIAPTGDDWELKLGEVPLAYSRPLAVALLHGGNFACPVPPASPSCPREIEIPDPAPAADMSDPCLRRLLALWATSQLDDDDIPAVFDSLKAIAALPPPESQLVAAAIDAIDEDDHARRLELIDIAHRAGNVDVAGNRVGKLDEPHQIQAVKQHIAAGLDGLTAETHRDIFLAAIIDEALAPRARAAAITELAELPDPMAADVKKALVKATAAKDCLVAATAMRVLAVRGDTRYLPRRPRGSSPDAMMRALCVLASYELQQDADEPSLLSVFVPAKGLELEVVHFDALAEDDTDGDGDPRTSRTLSLVPHADADVYENADMVRAFRSCTKTTCSSSDREYRFHFKPGGGGLYLSRLEVVELPSCPTP